MGLASYSLREFTQAKAIAMTKRAGLDYICFKSMHLPLSATPKELENIAKKVNDAGLTLYGGTHPACGNVNNYNVGGQFVITQTGDESAFRG